MDTSQLTAIATMILMAAITPVINRIIKLTEAKTLFQSQLDMEKMHDDVYSRMFANLKIECFL